MLAVDYMRQEKQRQLDAAQALTDKADSEARSLTEDEKNQIKSLLGKAADFEVKINEFEDNEKIRDSIRRLGEVHASTEPTETAKARTVGEAFVRSDAYKALKATGMRNRWIMPAVELKANTGFVAESEGDNLDTLLPQRVPGITTPVEQELTIADLFGQGQIGSGSNSIMRVVETGTDNAAATVGEGDTKPPSYFELDTKGATLRKIATTITVSQEMLEDVTAIRDYLNNRLGFFVRAEEESQLVSDLLGAGIGSADETDIDGDNLFDAVLAAIAQVQTNGGLRADALVISPMDNARLQVKKAQTGGLYYSGGPYAGPDQNPWGLRSVITTAVSDGSPVVGAFRAGATLWRKGGLSVDATNSHEDYFERNLVMIRAEERLVLDVHRPAAFVQVGLSTT